MRGVREGEGVQGPDLLGSRPCLQPPVQAPPARTPYRGPGSRQVEKPPTTAPQPPEPPSQPASYPSPGLPPTQSTVQRYQGTQVPGPSGQRRPPGRFSSPSRPVLARPRDATPLPPPSQARLWALRGSTPHPEGQGQGSDSSPAGHPRATPGGTHGGSRDHSPGEGAVGSGTGARARLPSTFRPAPRGSHQDTPGEAQDEPHEAKEDTPRWAGGQRRARGVTARLPGTAGGAAARPRGQPQAGAAAGGKPTFPRSAEAPGRSRRPIDPAQWRRACVSRPSQRRLCSRLPPPTPEGTVIYSPFQEWGLSARGGWPAPHLAVPGPGSCLSTSVHLSLASHCPVGPGGQGGGPRSLAGGRGPPMLTRVLMATRVPTESHTPQTQRPQACPPPVGAPPPASTQLPGVSVAFSQRNLEGWLLRDRSTAPPSLEKFKCSTSQKTPETTSSTAT